MERRREERGGGESTRRKRWECERRNRLCTTQGQCHGLLSLALTGNSKEIFKISHTQSHLRYMLLVTQPPHLPEGRGTRLQKALKTTFQDKTAVMMMQ